MSENGETTASNEITMMLLDWGRGDPDALNRLIPAVHRELRKIAAAFMRKQRPDITLQTTALVNEAYLKLIDSDRVNWQSRTHFFAIAAQAMRRILVDAARKRNSLKRGGENIRVTLDDALNVHAGKDLEVIALDEALVRLAELNPRHSRIVELRYFGGLTEDQVAETLNISTRTVRRDWSVARAWLFRELQRQ